MKNRKILLVEDIQNNFCYPNVSLYIKGAEKLIESIYQNLYAQYDVEIIGVN